MAHNQALACVYNLALHNAAEAKDAAPACIKLLHKGLAEGQDNYSACKALAALAADSKRAASEISGLVSKIFEKDDDDDEQHATQVVYSLRVLCQQPAGATAACKVNLVDEVSTALTNARSRGLRGAALNMLAALAGTSETARTSMRDGPLVEEAVARIAAMVKNPMENSVGVAALRLLLVLSESESLRAAIRAASPLDSLESLCATSSDNRTTALMLVANTYSATLDAGLLELFAVQPRSVSLRATLH